VLVAIFALCAIFAPWIAPQDPAHIDLPNRLQSPSAQHWLNRRTRPRHSLPPDLGSAYFSVRRQQRRGLFASARLIIGSFAGYYGEASTAHERRPDECVSVLPGILIAIAFVAFRGPGIFNLILALSLGGWVGYARLVRAQVLSVRGREFVEAARALGAGDLHIVTRTSCPTSFSR